jgi:hypothetical protein
MKHTFLIFLLLTFSPAQIFAQGTDVDAVKAVLKLPGLIPNGNLGESCVQCKDTVDNGHPSDLFCKDLFKSTCLNPDGSSKTEGGYVNGLKLLKIKLKEARDLAAKEMGHKDFIDAIKKTTAADGIDVGDLSDAQLKNIMQENDPGNYDEYPKYPLVTKCEEQLVLDTDKKQYINDTKAKWDQYKELQVKTDVLNLSAFMTSEFAVCENLKKSEKYPVEKNKDIYEKCKRLPSIRAEAISLYRKENTFSYKNLAEKFVRKNRMPMLIEKQEQESSEPFNDEYLSAKNQVNEICNNLKNSVNAAVQKKANSFATDLTKTKTVIDHMIDSYYNPQTKYKALELLEFSKNSIKTLVPKITADKVKAKTIMNGYDQLKLAWLDKPKESEYEMNTKTGLMTLKATDQESELTNAFSDSRLGYFTDINAFYSPLEFEGGKVANPDMVHMMPYFLATLDKNKYTFLSVVAHEAGHKIGPVISKMNGHDLNSDWKDLLKCYGQIESIKMEDFQKDETIADYISSEVLTKSLSELPKNERRNAYMQSMNAFCIFNDGDNAIRSFGGEVHPDAIYRINGIYGSNPHLREAMDCPESSDYKSCVLK